MSAEINVTRFFERLERLQTDWMTHKSSIWGGADAICIPFGSAPKEDENDLIYSKPSAIHLHLLGYEFPDSIIVITRSNFYFMATAKKCQYLETLVGKHSTITVNLLNRTKDELQNRELFNTLMGAIRKGGGKTLGMISKGEFYGSFVPSWKNFVTESEIETFEISPALGLLLSVKDEQEMVY